MAEFVRRTSQLLIKHRRLVMIILLTLGLVLFLSLLPRITVRSIVESLLAQRFLILLIFLFTLISLSLLFSAGQRMDAGIFLFFNLKGRRPDWLDLTMTAITQLGSGFPALSAGGLFYLSGDRRLAVELILGTLTLLISVETIKALVDRSRPFIKLENTRLVGSRARGRSFPSGHTSQAFFVASMFIHHFELNLGPTLALYGLAALVGFTRIYLGAHYPRDVLAGAVLGEVWGLLAVLIRTI